MRCYLIIQASPLPSSPEQKRGTCSAEAVALAGETGICPSVASWLQVRDGSFVGWEPSLAVYTPPSPSLLLSPSNRGPQVTGRRVYHMRG